MSYMLARESSKASDKLRSKRSRARRVNSSLQSSSSSILYESGRSFLFDEAPRPFAPGGFGGIIEGLAEEKLKLDVAAPLGRRLAPDDALAKPCALTLLMCVSSDAPPMAMRVSVGIYACLGFGGVRGSKRSAGSNLRIISSRGSVGRSSSSFAACAAPCLYAARDFHSLGPYGFSPSFLRALRSRCCLRESSCSRLKSAGVRCVPHALASPATRSFLPPHRPGNRGSTTGTSGVQSPNDMLWCTRAPPSLSSSSSWPYASRLSRRRSGARLKSSSSSSRSSSISRRRLIVGFRAPPKILRRTIIYINATPLIVALAAAKINAHTPNVVPTSNAPLNALNNPPPVFAAAAAQHAKPPVSGNPQRNALNAAVKIPPIARSMTVSSSSSASFPRRRRSPARASSSSRISYPSYSRPFDRIRARDAYS
mmetsp:Transcript_8596/g.28356  ORF Transcript_8596/g.28356 Transcript_8596/m.28356 type:complete len:425 (-) Transcript_8596:70-1344(-)